VDVHVTVAGVGWSVRIRRSDVQQRMQLAVGFVSPAKVHHRRWASTLQYAHLSWIAT